MSIKVTLNKEISVTAVFFKNNSRIDAYPSRIEYDGKTFLFTDGTKRTDDLGGRSKSIYSMVRGDERFEIEPGDKGFKWILLGITRTA